MDDEPIIEPTRYPSESFKAKLLRTLKRPRVIVPLLALGFLPTIAAIVTSHPWFDREKEYFIERLHHLGFRTGDFEEAKGLIGAAFDIEREKREMRRTRKAMLAFYVAFDTTADAKRFVALRRASPRGRQRFGPGDKAPDR